MIYRKQVGWDKSMFKLQNTNEHEITRGDFMFVRIFYLT